MSSYGDNLPSYEEAQSEEGIELESNSVSPDPSPVNSADESQVEIVEVLETVPLLVGTFDKYADNCTCGVRYQNNCAHYLSNAFKLQYPSIVFPSDAAKCPHGRMIRAKEMLKWFKSTYSKKFEENHRNIEKKYWFVYQEDSGGQGHVCIHNHTVEPYTWRGTGDYPNWPVQWHYYY